jgi:hypothetical protein
MRRRLTRSSESCSVISASFVFWAITCIGAAQPRSGHTHPPTSEGDAKHGVCRLRDERAHHFAGSALLARRACAGEEAVGRGGW